MLFYWKKVKNHFDPDLSFGYSWEREGQHGVFLWDLCGIQFKCKQFISNLSKIPFLPEGNISFHFKSNTSWCQIFLVMLHIKKQCKMRHSRPLLKISFFLFWNLEKNLQEKKIPKFSGLAHVGKRIVAVARK